MSIERAKPMSDFGFRAMSFFLALRSWFLDFRKPLRQAGIREGQTVLDFGCGPGYYTIPAAKMVGDKGRVYALDVHHVALRSVEARARKEGLTNITTILAGRDAAPPDWSVDVVLAYDMIHMVKDKRALGKELHRVLKPDGLLSVIVEHTKVDDVLGVLEEGGLFLLRDRQGNLINLTRGVAR
jgi:ubiquinone/menaquinone biosynthesis C-methylase UbiE